MILLRTLGDCTIEIGEARLAPDSEILFSLLTYMIVERGRPIARSTLLELLWPDENESKARHCLRQSIYKLRHMGVPVETRSDRYVLTSRCASTDFEQLDLKRNSSVPIDDSMLHIFPDFAPRVSRKFLDWLEQLKQRHLMTVRDALLGRIAQARRANDWRSAMRLATQCIAIDPLNEEAIFVHAEGLAMTGDKTRALGLLEQYSSDVGELNSDLRIPATILRRRISEALGAASTAMTRQPFIGRDDSMSWLWFYSERVLGGEGATCLIRGAAGLGKSRLVSEFANLTAIKGGFRTVRVECRSTSSDRALSIFMELMPRLLRLPGSLGCSPQSLAFVRRLGEHTPEPGQLEQSAAEALTLHDSIRESVLDLLDALAAERPLVLVVEDVHLVDSVSASMLREIARSNKRRSLLLLLTTRPNDGKHRSQFDVWPYVLTHDLEPLSPTCSRELARELCTDSAVDIPEEVLNWCATQGDGNPFFIIELARQWQESGDASRIPASLDSLLGERIAHLSSAALRTLQAAALLGAHCSYQNLERLLGFPRWRLLESVDELATHGLALPTQEGVTARHELISRAALRRLSQVAQSMLHSAAAQCLELQENSSRNTATLWDAATHWSLSGDRAKAVSLSQQCAEHLMAVGLPHEASELLRKALAFANSDVERLQLHAARRAPLTAAASWQGLIENANAALHLEKLARRDSMQVHSEYELDFFKAHCVEATTEEAGVIPRALCCAEDETAGIDHRLAAASQGLAACYAEGKRQEASRFFSIVSSLSPIEEADKRNSIICRLIYNIEYGDVYEAAPLGDELLRQAQKEGGSRLSRFLRLSAYGHRILGHFDIAVERLAQARAFAHSHQVLPDYCEALSSSVQHFCSTEDFDLAWLFAVELVEVFKSRPYLVLPGVWLTCAEVALMRGDVSTAKSFVDRTVPSKALRPKGDRLALEMGCSMAMGSEPKVTQVEELLATHLRIRCYAGQDFPTGVLCSALVAIGRQTEAVMIASEYLTHHRRERWRAKHAALLRHVPTLAEAPSQLYAP